MTPPLFPRTWGGWFRAIAAAVVLIGGAYTSWLVFDGYQNDRQDSEVLASLNEAIANQQQSAEATECARTIYADGEIAQLDSLDVLSLAFLDLVEDNEVSPPTVGEVEELRLQLAAAREGYEDINTRCPVPTGLPPENGNPNSDP